MHFCWIDLETTGLNPRLDHILEVALVVTGADLEEQTAFTLVVNPALDGHKAWADRLDDPVKQMHEASGLLRDISTGVSLRSAEDALLQTLDRFKGDRYILGGLNIERLERPFIDAQLRRLARRLSYRSLDVLAVRRFLRDVCGRTDLMPTFADADAKRHRALDDILDTLAEARIYRTYLDLIPGGI